MGVKVPRSIYHLLGVMSRQEPQAKFQNEGKRSRGSIKNRQQQMQVRVWGREGEEEEEESVLLPACCLLI